MGSPGAAGRRVTPHVHGREERFYVLEGKITFTGNCGRVVATAGTFAHMPFCTPYGLRNESDRPAKVLSSVATAGLEQMFFEVGVPLGDPAERKAPIGDPPVPARRANAPRPGRADREAACEAGGVEHRHLARGGDPDTNRPGGAVRRQVLA
jgi:hypothetical protein